ncbi:Transcription termination factor MTERF8, chloroplastic-like protein [Drosera capensis]
MWPFSRFFFLYAIRAREAVKPVSGHLMQRRLLSSPANGVESPSGSVFVLDFLKKSGFSDAQLEKMVKRVPKIVKADLEKTIKPKIQVFLDWGFSGADTGEVLSKDPYVLLKRGPDKISASLAILKRVLGSDLVLMKAVKSCPWFLKHDLERSLVPNVELLASRGVSMPRIVLGIRHHPRVFIHRPKAMAGFVKKVEEIGVDERSCVFLLAIITISSMHNENWESKLELFRRLGFGEDDLLNVIRRCPQVFSFSEIRIKNAVEFYLGRGKVDIPFIVEHPSLLTLSLERRLKPRIMVLDELMSKKLLKNKPPLTSVMKLSHERFRKNKPNPIQYDTLR